MKRLFLQLLVIIVFAGMASAFPVPGDYVKIYDGTWGTTSGGEFDIDVLFKGGPVDYVSFCLEKNENFSPGYPYYVYSVEDYAELGGISGAVAGKDWLDDRTKFTYWTYTFTNTFGAKSDVLANNVQEVIWWLEGETGSLSSVAQAFYTTNIASVSDYTTGIGKVKALNIGYWDDTNFVHVQSQLIAEPVPEPATMLLFGTGLVSLAALSRRKTRTDYNIK